MTRVVLLDLDGTPAVSDLATSLRAADVEATVLGSEAGARAAEAVLARRGFMGGLGHVPLVTARLWRSDFDLAHAFTAPDALGALAWRRATRRPVVFTCTETLDRGVLANRRLRLWTLERATQDVDAVLAASEAVAAAMWRWLALEAPVLEASAYARLYGELLARRS